MKRRHLLALLGGSTVIWPLGGHAQQKAMPVIGYLHPGGPPDRPAGLAAFRQGLSETSYVEGKNLTIEYRWAESQYDRLPALAADLVGRKVDLIAAVGNAALAAKNATATIPIVFMGVGDPVGMGLVASLARPGGNLTGFSNLIGELISERLELLSDVVTPSRRYRRAREPEPTACRTPHSIRAGSRAREGNGGPYLKAGTEGEIDAAFASLVEPHVGGLVIAGDVFFYSRHEQLVALASRHAVPAIYAWRDVPLAGGLISYGIDNIAVWRQAGIYAGKILNGAKPADLPVEQPSKFELVINLKTAKALGLTVPQSLVARADEVIE
jgi:ABC-type uncharacterized transport system substrate-binding protein